MTVLVCHKAAHERCIDRYHLTVCSFHHTTEGCHRQRVDYYQELKYFVKPQKNDQRASKTAQRSSAGSVYMRPKPHVDLKLRDYFKLRKLENRL